MVSAAKALVIQGLPAFSSWEMGQSETAVVNCEAGAIVVPLSSN